jgi:predicted N-formylglutamate amidohydrolase
LNKSCADSTSPSKQLLGRDDPSVVVVTNPGGSSPILLLGDHAGRAIPKSLAGLGLPPEAMGLHIALDIGVEALGGELSRLLDACWIRQTYSRLVIDCNRRPDASDSIPSSSDGIAIPGNETAPSAQRARRRSEIFDPYHSCIAQALDERCARGGSTVLVSLHSFTPRFQGVDRRWRYGVLHQGDSPFSGRVLGLLRKAEGDAAGDNQPYAMDATDFTIPHHLEGRDLDYLELEVRQDLVAKPAGASEVAAFMAGLLSLAAQA